MTTFSIDFAPGHKDAEQRRRNKCLARYLATMEYFNEVMEGRDRFSDATRSRAVNAMADAWQAWQGAQNGTARDDY